MEAEALNRTMDRADLEAPRAREICAELNALVVSLRSRGLRVSSWYGALGEPSADGMAAWERANRGLTYEPLPDAADDERFPWFLYWEIAWLVMNNEFRAGQRLLDLGGSSSLFSCYMASRGLDVVTVDLKSELVANGEEVAGATGWSLRNLAMDMRELDDGQLGGRFDHITSVCVFEHLPLAGRIEVNRRIRELLVDGGSFSITFDYLNPSAKARIGSPADVEEQFVAPSGLSVRGNREFADNGLRYLLHPFHHPRAAQEGWQELSIELEQFPPERAGEVLDEDEYTFGALFQDRA
jgi:Methyltransferase domain